MTLRARNITGTVPWPATRDRPHPRSGDARPLALGMPQPVAVGNSVAMPRRHHRLVFVAANGSLGVRFLSPRGLRSRCRSRMLPPAGGQRAGRAGGPPRAGGGRPADSAIARTRGRPGRAGASHRRQHNAPTMPQMPEYQIPAFRAEPLGGKIVRPPARRIFRLLRLRASSRAAGRQSDPKSVRNLCGQVAEVAGGAVVESGGGASALLGSGCRFGGFCAAFRTGRPMPFVIDLWCHAAGPAANVPLPG